MQLVPKTGLSMMVVGTTLHVDSGTVKATTLALKALDAKRQVSGTLDNQH